ncbi:tryptophan-rich sensory protein [Microbacterium sp. NPDC057407]|uniref:tryptophan-rich sensory protein n=1 Tax=Microbacterium sp. NPDC057407 TaxID=3346120 RepID=UPI0036729FD8
MLAKDLARQIVVISCFCFMIIAAMVGTGLFGGTPVQDLQNGALDADGSYLAPARQAFSIWTVIYVGLLAYTVWQALPSQRERPRQRALGWLIAGTMVLNGAWLLTAQFLTLPLTVLAIVLLLALLGYTFHRVVSEPGKGWGDAFLIDGVTGLHLGWVTLATVANTTAWLTTILPADAADSATLWGIVVLAVVAVVGVAIAWASEWRIAPGLAMGWGLLWIGVGRLTGEPSSTAIGVTALIVAAIVVIVPLAGAVLHRAADIRNSET